MKRYCRGHGERFPRKDPGVFDLLGSSLSCDATDITLPNEYLCVWFAELLKHPQQHPTQVHSEHESASQKVTFQDSPNTDIFSNTPPLSPNIFSRTPGVSWDDPGPPSIKKVLHRSGFGTIKDLSGLTQNGEGGIRTHEGVTPTRFRVVRDQPDSATSPHALRRPRILKAAEPGTSSMLQKPTALGCGRLKPQPGSCDQLPGF